MYLEVLQTVALLHTAGIDPVNAGGRRMSRLFGKGSLLRRILRRIVKFQSRLSSGI